MLEGLNKFQKEAVLYNDGPMAVLSGGGSGKTRVLTTKVRYLVEELNVRPNRIYAFTFTNDAANEMRERLDKSMGDKASSLKVSTIHSMAYKILKSCRVNRNPNYRMPKPMVNTGPVLMHLFAFLKNGGYKTNDAKVMLANISGLKMNLITTKNYKQHINYLPEKEACRMSYEQVMHEFYKAYQKFLKSKGYMDFTDMLVDCYYELIDPLNESYVSRIQDRAEYVLLDEFQDVNRIAYNISKIISSKHNKMSVYGDARQNIFSFQGADDSIIREFISGGKTKIVDLPVNYRSTKTIVDNANKLISYQKNIIGIPSTTPNEVGKVISFHTSEDMESEANHIADVVEGAISSGKEYRDITVLYRVHSQAEQIVNEFMNRGIPHIQFIKTNFFLRKEIKDVITYLKIARNYEGATLKDIRLIVHRPSRYVSNAAIKALESYIYDNDCSVKEALENSRSLNVNSMQSTNLANLNIHLSTLSNMYEGGSDIESMIKYICRDTGIGYEAWAIQDKIDKDHDADITMDFDALIGNAEGFGSVDSFLESVDARIRASKEKPDPSKNAIKLMSIHASKGKEFHTVILAGFNDRLYPFHLAEKEGNSDEERRVVYVAVTRAIKELHISVINGSMGRFKVTPSRYLAQMNINYTGQNYGFNNTINRKDFFKDLQEGLEKDDQSI